MLTHLMLLVKNQITGTLNAVARHSVAAVRGVVSENVLNLNPAILSQIRTLYPWNLFRTTRTARTEIVRWISFVVNRNSATGDSSNIVSNEGDPPIRPVRKDTENETEPAHCIADSVSSKDQVAYLMDQNNILQIECFEDGKEGTMSARIQKSKKRKRALSDNVPDAEKLPRKAVTHFVAIQVSNLQIKEQVKSIQEKMLSSRLPLGFGSSKKLNTGDSTADETSIIFQDAMERLESLHFTLGVIGIDNGEIPGASEAVKRCWDKHKLLFQTKPMVLDILGLGHFGHKVIFAKIKDKEHTTRLEALAKDLQLEFQSSNIYHVSDKFKAHMTIAKMSRSKTLHKKKIKAFPPEMWSDHELHHFGQQPVESLQLLAMSMDPTTKYYRIINEFRF